MIHDPVTDRFSNYTEVDRRADAAFEPFRDGGSPLHELPPAAQLCIYALSAQVAELRECLGAIALNTKPLPVDTPRRLDKLEFIRRVVCDLAEATLKRDGRGYTIPPIPEAIFAAVREIQRFSETDRAAGNMCCMHIMLDDENTGDEDAEFCAEEAAREGHSDCIHIASVMLGLTDQERAVACYLFNLWDCLPEQQAATRVRDAAALARQAAATPTKPEKP